MASLQIRDMPEDLYESLKQQAAKDHRSLAQQAVALLAEALKADHRSSARRLAAIEKLRSSDPVATSPEVDVVELVREDRNR